MASSCPAAISVGLKGCEIAPDVNIAQARYGIRLSVPSQDGMSELWIKCENVSRTIHENNSFISSNNLFLPPTGVAICSVDGGISLGC